MQRALSVFLLAGLWSCQCGQGVETGDPDAGSAADASSAVDSSISADAASADLVGQDTVGYDAGVVDAAQPDSYTPTTTDIIPAERRVVWQGNVGVPGGIPARTTVCATVDAATYGDGSTDATSAIQDALDSCPEGQTVLLEAGTYRITSTVFMRSGRTLRGAGMDSTVISFEGSGARAAIGFNDWPNFSAAVAVTAGATKGSTTITVASAADAQVGSVMRVDQLNDGDLVDPDGVEGICVYCGRENGTRTLGQLVEVTAVNGDDITFDVPLYWSYDAALSPEAGFVGDNALVRDAGLESLTLTQPDVSATYLIEFQGAQRCWMLEVEVERVDWRAVWMQSSLQNEIRRCYFHESINGYGRSHGYGVLLDRFSSANLVEDNIFRTLDGGFMMTTGGAAGNVLAYNYMYDSRFDDGWWLTQSPSLNHAPHPMMNLWEGNVGYQIGSDFIHGSASHNTVFRARSFGWQQESITANNNAVAFATKNTYMNVVGSVLGTTGRSTRYEVLPGQAYSNSEVVIWALGIMHGVDDANVEATLLRHGNYDYVNNDTVWDPAISSQTIPASLYLDSKPSWFGAVAWPPIGPDVSGLYDPIPAQLRFEAMTNP